VYVGSSSSESVRGLSFALSAVAAIDRIMMVAENKSQSAAVTSALSAARLAAEATAADAANSPAATIWAPFMPRLADISPGRRPSASSRIACAPRIRTSDANRWGEVTAKLSGLSRPDSVISISRGTASASGAITALAPRSNASSGATPHLRLFEASKVLANKGAPE